MQMNMKNTALLLNKLPFSKCLKPALLLIVMFLSLGGEVLAQVDTEFWFAAPRMLSGHNKKKEAEYHIVVFNPNSVTANVSISQPAAGGSGYSSSVSVESNSGKDITVAQNSGVYPNNDIISVPYDVVSKVGLYIKSDVAIQCYFQVTDGNGEAYTMKGQNALGKEFVVAMQNKFDNGRGGNDDMYDDAYAAVAIVATQDNTSVTITPVKNITPSCNTKPITITLNKGETYAFHACTEKAADRPIGTLIQSNKPIAVTYNDDSVIKGSRSDAIGEQLISTQLAGDEYVIVSNQSDCDYAFLVGLENSTYLSDNNGKKYNLDKGTVTAIDLTSTPALYLKGNKPFEVFQVTDNGGEMGGTILPQISCTGSTTAYYKKVNKNIILNLVTRSENAGNISVNGTPIAASEFTQLGATNYSYYAKDWGSVEKVIVTSTGDAFQMGVLDYTSKSTATYGFFSDYTSLANVTFNEAETQTGLVCQYNVCKGEDLKINIGLDSKIDINSVEWYDLINNQKLVDIHGFLDMGSVVVDTAAYKVSWNNSCGVEASVTICVKVNPTYEIIKSHTATNSYTWEGQTYTQSGTYSRYYTTKDGCDSTLILNLTINNLAPTYHPFTVGPCKQTVNFSFGNLYYRPSDKSWMFASRQFDIIGSANSNVSSTYNGCIDLFGWGTGNNPLQLSTNAADYATGVYDLLGTNNDWGHNINDGNSWRTLSKDEWDYLLDKRIRAAELRGNGSVDGVNGIIILPDDWKQPDDVSFKSGGNFSNNTYTADDWAKMEHAGAIFLPCGGWRHPENIASIYKINTEGYYWSATADSETNAWELKITESNHFMNSYSRFSGVNIRLVKDLNAVPMAIYGPIINTTQCLNIDKGQTFKWRDKVLSKSGNYFDTIPSVNGCDSIIGLHLVVNRKYEVDTMATACDSFVWRKKTYYESGTYPFQKTTKQKCDSIVNLQLTINKSYHGDVENISACKSYTWHGKTFTESGVYYDSLLTAAGCDSIHTLNLTISQTKEIRLPDTTACDFLFWHGLSITKSGEYADTLISVDGCDSIVKINVIIHQSVYDEISDQACNSYEWNGNTYTTSGDYDFKGKTIHGCDSVVTLHLTIFTDKASTDQLTLCEGEPFEWGDYKIDKVSLQDAKDYSHIFKTIHGCDSVVTLKLTVNPTYDVEIEHTLCDNETYTWEGTTYQYTNKRTQTVKKTLQTINGCDSVVTMTLHFNETKVKVINAQICDGDEYVLNGEVYTKKGNYKQYLKTTAGCDSIIDLHLSVNPSYFIEFTDTISTGETIEWEGKTYTTSGDYKRAYKTAAGCDSVLVLHLKRNAVDAIVPYSSNICVENGTFADITFRVTRGYIEMAKLKFGEKGHKQGLKDTTIIINGSTSEFNVRIPLRSSIRAGVYPIQVDYLFHNEVYLTQTAHLTILYPSSVIAQKWDDFLGVQTDDYNGGYHFVKFKWYKNGQLLQGENGSYIYQPLDFNADYYALLTDSTGLQLQTCPFRPKPRENIIFYPTNVRAQQKIRLQTTQPSSMKIYDTTGKLVREVYCMQGANDIEAPQQTGLYIAKIILQDGQEKIVKFVVR